MNLPVFTLILVSLLIGLHGATRVAGKVRNFYVAGNIIPSWVIVASLLGQAIDSGSSLGNASAAGQSGFWAGAIFPIGIGISLMLIGFFFAEPLHKMRILTLADFYGRQYGRRVETMAGLLCVISFAVLLASNFAGAGIVLHYFLRDVPQDLLIAGVAAVIMVYVIAGGLFAATWNDILHSGVMITGFGAALVWLFVARPHAPATVDAGFSWAPLHKIDAGALPTWSTLIALGLGDIVALDFMERVFAAKTGRHARTACIISGLIAVAMGAAIAMIGIFAGSAGATDGSADSFFTFVNNVLPAGIGMMVFMALIAACLSTADGVLMACSSVITRNIVQHNFPELIPQSRLLLMSRVFLIPLTIIACVFAIVRPNPGDLLVIAFEVVLAGCLVPLVLGVYWKRANARAAFWAILIPSILRVVLYFTLTGPWAGLGTLLPPLLSLVIFVAISLGTSGERSLEPSPA